MTFLPKTETDYFGQWPASLRATGRAAAVVGVVIVLWAGYIWFGQPVTLVINDQPYRLRLHRLTVAAVVQELGLALAPEDVIEPPIGARLQPGDQVTIRLASPVIIEVDGRTIQKLTHRKTVGGILDEAKVVTNPHDKILLDHLPVAAGTRLASRQIEPPLVKRAAALPFSVQTPRAAILAIRSEPVHLLVRRAVPVTLIEGRVRQIFYSTQLNVGEALLEQGFTPFLGDQVTPDLGTRVTPGMRIYIERSTPVSVTVDGRTIRTRTRRQTIGEVLAEAGIALMGRDFSRPSAEQPISVDDDIEVVRVREALEIEQEFIPFETSWVADETMELDRQEIRQPGATGVIKTRTRIRFENGQEVWRQVEDEWLDQVPSDRLIAYGTKIVIRTLETPEGPIEYWRRIPVLVTAYNAAVSGKDADHPRYGITRSGLPAGFGLVAVDPKVIPMMTKLYIPKYGSAVAADTGGRVLGKHVDLGYDEDQPLPILYEWRDVYVLTPVPVADRIRYVLPQWPQR